MELKICCTFCGTVQAKVKKLIQAPTIGIFICDACVELCSGIMRTDEQVVRQKTHRVSELARTERALLRLRALEILSTVAPQPSLESIDALLEQYLA